MCLPTVWSTTYQPFGTTPVPTGTITQNLRFPGQYFDGETGFSYNLNRDYMPNLGRYLQSDPVGIEGGINLYQYAGSNPLRVDDPSGLDCTGSGTAYEYIKSILDSLGVGQDVGNWFLSLVNEANKLEIPGDRKSTRLNSSH